MVFLAELLHFMGKGEPVVCEIHLRDGPVSLRPLEQRDAGSLLKWMTDPAVLEWYEGRDAVFTTERVQEDFYEEEPGCRRCTIEYEGLPIGYIQIYKLTPELCEEYQYPHPELSAFGIDQFIGEPAYWDRKIGRRFLKLVLEYLTGQEGAQAVILDPHADNFRALRCYEACGFQKIKFLPAHELHEGSKRDCWLMEFRGR